jgi:hypothetical protein
MTRGVKGSDVYDTTGSHLLDLYVMLNRGLDAESIKAAVKQVVATGSQDRQAALEDAFTLAFQTRDVRGGKGERDLFQHLWLALHQWAPSIAVATLPLVPEYGYWRDVFDIAAAGTAGPDSTLQNAAFNVAKTQFLKDEAALQAPRPEGAPAPTLSLLGKWAPREHSNNAATKAQARLFAQVLCPGPKSSATYRASVSVLNKALNTPEIAMCAKAWSSLNPATVPGRCLKTKVKGFLNQPVKGAHGRKAPSTDPDRVACAARFAEHFAQAAQGLAKVKGADTVFPHELVGKIVGHIYANGGHHYGGHDAGLTSEELASVEAQWLSIVDGLKASGTTLGRSLAMCDFSGSMGDKMWIAMALGILIATFNRGPFKDCILTFDSKPTLHRFTASSLLGRVSEVIHLAQGTSTDFQAAYNLVLKTMIDSGCPVGWEPKDLIVLTDMGWDAACGCNQYSGYTGSRYSQAVKTKATETHDQIARRAFTKHGELLYGDGNGWTAPRIVIWNLAASFKDFHATANTDGVVNVSGWSPSLLKTLSTNGADALTPAAMLRAQLQDPRYAPVRAAVAAAYALIPPTPA